MDDDAISRIEAALEAGPTPGPWRHEAWGSRILDSGVGSRQLLITTVAANTFRDQGRHNAEFIAACNPVAIRTLLDRLKAAEQRAEYWKAEQLAANTENERLRESLRGLLAVTSSKAPGTGLIVGAEDRHAAAIKQARAALEGKE